MSMHLVPVVLCGGSGTRLWPMSREHFPKQLLKLTGEDSLLQATVARVSGLGGCLAEAGAASVATTSPVVIANESHRFLVAEQLRQAGLDDARIMLEPVGRNTAPAVCLAAEYVVREYGDGLLLVMPADHVVRDVTAFQRAVAAGVALAQEGFLVTFGVIPNRAETGFGYIRKGQAVGASGATRIGAFVEKPNEATAQAYLESKSYLWNSGMFLFSASAWLRAVEAARPDIAEAARTAFTLGRPDIDFFRVDKAAFDACPSDSIDYAVMEKVAEGAPRAFGQGVVIPLDAGWSDVGSWQSLWEVTDKDADGNVASGDVILEKTRNSMVMSESRLTAVLGLDHVVVVETSDAVLVAHKDAAQDVKKIVDRIKRAKRGEATSHRRVYRPWGSYEGVDAGERFQVKRIVVKQGASLSLQMHHHRAEHWIVVKGTARVTRGDEQMLLTENQSTYIPLGVVHRLENPGSIPLEIIEVQSGSYLGEDDIVRFEDQYGRDTLAK